MPIKLIHNAGSDEISTSTITSSTKRKGFDDENTPPVKKPCLNNTLLEEASGSKRQIIIKSSTNRNHVFAPVQNMSPIQLNNSIGSINDKTQTKIKRTDDQDMQANKKLCLPFPFAMPNWNIIGSILLPNVGGWISTLTMAGQVKNPNGNAWYQTIKKPSWNPPNWVFAPAWTTLYASMGYASYMVYRDCGGFTDDAVLPLALYGGQLVLNWTWTPVFFRFHQIGLAFLHMLALDVAATACTVSFVFTNKNTAYFMMPYLWWLTFATCLNYSIWKLNRDDDGANKKN